MDGSSFVYLWHENISYTLQTFKSTKKVRLHEILEKNLFFRRAAFIAVLFARLSNKYFKFCIVVFRTLQKIIVKFSNWKIRLTISRQIRLHSLKVRLLLFKIKFCNPPTPTRINPVTTLQAFRHERAAFSKSITKKTLEIWCGFMCRRKNPIALFIRIFLKHLKIYLLEIYFQKPLSTCPDITFSAG